jgi:anti-anti-sigma factor
MDFQAQPVELKTTPTGFDVKLHGAIHTNTAWIESEFKKVIAAKPKAVALDLADTTFISSMGIGLLVWLYNKVKEEGGTVQIVAVRKRVLSTMKFARLDTLLLAPTATVLPD